MARNRVFALAIGLVAAVSGQGVLAACEAPPLDGPAAWLPVTPFPELRKPAPHPASDCPFYEAAWQTFLHVAQPDAAGDPAFLGYPRIETVFEPFGANAGKPAADPFGADLASGVQQAGMGGILIDQNGSPVYYAMHFNDRFADFVAEKGLATREGILAADPNLSFDAPGIVELKSAWRVLDASDDRSAFFWKDVDVPRLVIHDGKVEIDPSGATHPVTVGLVALHVVFTMEGHPEFVWSTFEHVDRQKQPDGGPTAADNPEDTPDDYVAHPDRSFPFYQAGADAQHSNLNGLLDADDMAGAFDVETQTFTANGGLQTPVYREYPASKVATTEVDEAILELNASLWGQFAEIDPRGQDPRGHYALVGATWLDLPERDFAVGKYFINGPEETSDTGPVAGEDALSNLMMESFTQSVFPNCFSCHDTREVYSTEGGQIVAAKNINVSHAFSHYLSGGR